MSLRKNLAKIGIRFRSKNYRAYKSDLEDRSGRHGGSSLLEMQN